MSDERPERHLAIPPTRVGEPPAARRKALIALVALGAAVAVAIGLAQVPPPAPVAASAAPAIVPAPVATRSQPPSVRPSTAGSPDPAPVAVTSRRLSRDDLAAAVHDGSLDERLVFIDGELRVTPARCESLAQSTRGCVDLAIPGLGLRVWAGHTTIPWRGDPPAGAWLVTVARAGGLVYLGALVPEPDRASSVGQLTRRLLDGRLGDPPGTLFEVDGWLVAHPVDSCAPRGPRATPCPDPPAFLAAEAPSDTGRALRLAAGGPVDLASPLVDVDPAQAIVPGTFLLAPPERCDPARAVETCPRDARWLVIARYEPSRSVRALVP